MRGYLLLAALVAVFAQVSAWDIGIDGISCGDLCEVKLGKCNFEASAFINTPAKLEVIGAERGWSVARLALAKAALPFNNARKSSCQSPSGSLVVCCCNFDNGCEFNGINIGVRCNGSSYEFKPPTPTSSRRCRAVTKCTKSQYVVADPTRTSDRVCAPIGATSMPTTTHPSPACLDYQYEKAPPTATSRRVCMPIRECNLDVEYETKPPTLTSNRGCAFIKECGPNQYEVLPPTEFTQRVCAKLPPI
eukprot:m.50189 g.50189  ORF g.50189 m.50189 type:complete len:248 (+) comp48077_c0_seq1:137-880(+)